MDPKILNTDDNDKLNPMAGVRNYGAGSEDGDGVAAEAEAGEDNQKAGDQPVPEAEEPVLPDEIANPEEQDERDEMA